MKQKMYEIIGQGESCPKCKSLMQRRKRIKKPVDKSYFFTEWDYCSKCFHVQHYEKFKNTTWQEIDRQQSFFDDLKSE